MKLNANKGSGSTTLTIRLSVEDRDYLRTLAGKKKMNVNAFVRSHMLDFLSREAVKDWAHEQLGALTTHANSLSPSALSKDVLEAIFASYYMLYEIVNARDPKASQRAIELGQKDTERELRHSAPRRS
jgi:hypothetical protein